MGVVCIDWWVWSVSIGGCGLYELVSVVCINWWVWSASNEGGVLYQLVGVAFIKCVVLDDCLICCYLNIFTIVFRNVCISQFVFRFCGHNLQYTS